LSDFLNTLKERFADAQRRLQFATARLQQAQQEHAAVTQEFGSWQNAINVETRREAAQEQQRLLIEQQRQQQEQFQRAKASVVPPPVPTVIPAAPPGQLAVAPTVPSLPPTATPPTVETAAETLSKTDLIRNVLKQHPNGIVPVDLWREVKDQVDRNYVYSVLKRLKDSKQVAERRGKYYLQVTATAGDEDEKRDSSEVH
jgi:putative SOS response-associated peptidase YedK